MIPYALLTGCQGTKGSTRPLGQGREAIHPRPPPGQQERERDEARNRADVLCWNEGKTEGIAKGILKPFEFAPVGATPPHPVLQAAHAVSAVVIERDLALRELAELKAKGEKL